MAINAKGGVKIIGKSKMIRIMDRMGSIKKKRWWMNKEVPQTIVDVGFDFIPDNKQVWAIVEKEEIPLTLMPIGELIWAFDYPFLWHGSEVFNLKPIDVVNNLLTYTDEHTRILKADMQYPIDIMKTKRDQGSRWLTLDGLHRLMKAYILNKEAHGGIFCKDMLVKTHKVPRKNIPFIKRMHR